MMPKLKKYCFDLGFDLFGVIKPEKVSGFDKFERWLKDGNHADMKWMENNLDKREDPRLILEGCQSIIVLGASYFNRNYTDDETNDPDQALIARYAWGSDYHLVIKSKLAQIVSFLDARIVESEGRHNAKFKVQNSKPQLKTQNQLPRNRYATDRYKLYTDTGPILEKWLGATAGLGFIGRNSCLINHKIGSYFFLATIFTTLPLPEYKEKIIGSCGDCRRCIDACPTGAVNNDGTIDARKCISYHTIENKGEIPSKIKSKMKNRIFGCDICQEACPWNKFARPTRIEELRTKNGRDRLKTSQLQDMRREEYQQLFKKSAVKRAGFDGLKRNCDKS